MNRWTLFLLLFLAFCASSASAALPPMDDAERQESSDRVVRGEIRAIYTRRRKKRDDFTDLELLLEILVEESTKGKSQVGETVYVRCWIADERPDGWVGDGGQRPRPREGESGLFYIKESGPGVLRLLDPNGWNRD